MSRENLETIARLYDEFLARPERVTDPEILQFFDPTVEIRQSESFFGTAGTFHGYEGLARSAEEVFEVFRELCWVPIRLIDAGEHVVATVEARGYGRHSHAKVKETIAHVWTLREGRITAWQIHMDVSRAFEAVGLPQETEGESRQAP